MRKWTEIAAAEGDVVFDRAREGDTPCTCCPEGRHIWMRYLALDHVDLTIVAYLRKLFEQHPELEGKRLRVTLSTVEEE